MEPILNFLEQYWGYTLFGSITVGTLVTFIIVSVKLFLKYKASNKDTKAQQELVTGLLNVVNEKDLTIKELKNEMHTLVDEKVKQMEYFNRVQSITFEAISYLIMASKLPTEDKITIMNKFNMLVPMNTSVQIIKTPEVKEEAVITDPVEEVSEAVEKSQSLLEKYNNE